MKNLFFFFFAVCLSFQASAAGEVVIPEVDATTFSFVIDLAIEEAAILPVVGEEVAACMIVGISACGGSVSTQYCDEGLHGSLSEWVQNIGGQLCQRELAAQD